MKLRAYTTTDTPRGTGLTCPRKDCGGKFILNYEQVLAAKAERNTSTIVCPYCSKISAIPPEDRQDGGDPSYLSDGNPYDLEKE